ncbi:PREDICTED: dentin sialophosphoprotein [Drosophila arizonae]|uniref:Dentin sialophosphoprotein n=1 Tax=Drosophila arizonae TaxID=7263 RepID=A0ABM1NYH2_DROAR|nr:PREDICTED: dentin sialophosphoprotein [Drosophila arizonae]
MPLKPKVPHIVGDDDEMSDVNDQAQMSDAVLDRVTSQIPTETSSSMAYGEESESSSSECSESSDDDGSDSDDEDSNSSAEEKKEKEEEEEDWSNSISYIVRTPVHEPETSLGTSAISASIVASEMETSETETAEIEVEQITDEATMEGDDSNVKPGMLTFTVPSSPEEESCNATRSSLDVETDPVNVDCDQLKASSVVNPNVENKVLDLSPVHRRRSLRSATRSNPAKYSAPPKKAAIARPRQRKRKVNSVSTSPNSIGARVAKRPRHSKRLTKSPAKNSDAPLARPIEVTEYFTNISATLVSHRINQVPFLYLRRHIDRLVGEALAKTKVH